MIYQVDPNSPVPIYEQIEAQVIFGIASGALTVGELIPSVREMGERLTVHPNTVAKAYQELEKAGVIETRRGRGMEVAADAPSVCRQRRQAIFSKRLSHVLREVTSSGLTPAEVRALVDHELTRLESGRNGR